MILESMTNNPSSTFFQGLFWDKLLEGISSNQKIAIKENILLLDFLSLVIEPLPLISVSIEVYSIRIKVSMRIGVILKGTDLASPSSSLSEAQLTSFKHRSKLLRSPLKTKLENVEKSYEGTKFYLWIE